MSAITPPLARRTLLAMSTMIASACTAHRSTVDPGVSGIRSGASTVSVVNRQWVDIRVYVMTQSGTTYRLGIVPLLGSGRFAVPPTILMPAERTFFAVPLGTDDPTIVGPVTVDVGTRLLLTISATLSGSSVVKRP